MPLIEYFSTCFSVKRFFAFSPYLHEPSRFFVPLSISMPWSLGPERKKTNNLAIILKLIYCACVYLGKGSGFLTGQRCVVVLLVANQHPKHATLGVWFLLFTESMFSN